MTVFDNLPGGRKGYPVEIEVTAQLDGSIAVQAADPVTGVKSTSILDYSERREKAECRHLDSHYAKSRYEHAEDEHDSI